MIHFVQNIKLAPPDLRYQNIVYRFIALPLSMNRIKANNYSIECKYIPETQKVTKNIYYNIKADTIIYYELGPIRTDILI